MERLALVGDLIVTNLKKFDKEYQTQFVEEMKFLKNNGVEYTFVKTINGVTTYKYEKNNKLFSLLSDFYEK